MASSSTNRGEPTTVPLRPILRNARHPESNSLLEPPRLKRVRPPNLPPPLPTPTFSASFPPASPFGVWPQCDVLAGPPRSPHVHFPPTPALASMRLTHSCTAYDRAPIIVDSSAALDLALPERGARVMSSLTTAAPLPCQYSREQQQQQRAIPRRSHTPIGSYFHPRAFEAQDGHEPVLPQLPLEKRVVARPRRDSRKHSHHQQLQQRRPVSAPATLADLNNVPDLTYSSYSSSSSSEPSDESDVRSDEDNIAIISDHSNFVFSPHPKALSFFPHSPMSPLSPRSRTHNLPVTQPSSPAASHAASRASSPSLLFSDSTTAPSAQTSSPIIRSKRPRRHPRTYSTGWAKLSNAAANDNESIFADDGCLGGF
ncbi:hypothetical protein FISHEDRAFT_72084 [Fistulina hepatica ATCC 64428]|uniref:Uncharacterized protein n=1 Tax=Fistulina hepatica ATCC 64428 TaxID=1128425 RepID=A0A0D7AFX3_9AGAR|nr:hypothetical protein FISHEDRAFT_72084 [Fistulina hepatica ATCC 64428]